MSGGRFDYFYLKLEELANEIYQKHEYTTEEKELSFLLTDLAQVLHDLEWWKSGDIGEEDFVKTYNKFKKKWLKVANRIP